MTLSPIREGKKTSLKENLVVLPPNDNEVSKFGIRNLPIDGLEGANKERRHRCAHNDTLQFPHQ